MAGAVAAALGLAAAAPAHAAYTSTSPSGTNATMTGDGAGDTLVIDTSGGLLRHNRTDPGFNSGFDWHTGLAGDQTVAGSSSTTITVNAGGGDDTLRVGSADAPASTVDALVTFDGQGNTDTLVYDEAADATGRTVNVSSTQVFIVVPGAAVNYPNVELLTIPLGSGPDLLAVQSTGAAVATIADGAAGADTFNVGTGGSGLDAIAGGIALNGGLGTDALALMDGVSSSPHRYVVGSETARRDAGAVVSFGDVLESLSLGTGSAADSIFKRSSVPATINAGGGDDAIQTDDAVRDFPTCGAGDDVAFVDHLDDVAGDCESVDRRAAPVTPAPTQTTTTQTITTTTTTTVPAPTVGRDVRGPRVGVTVPRSIRRSVLLRTGLPVTLAPDEASAITVDAIARPRSARLARAGDLTLATRSLPLAAGRRTAVLRPSRKLIARARPFSLRVVVTATDAARNRTVVTRTVRVR